MNKLFTLILSLLLLSLPAFARKPKPLQKTAQAKTYLYRVYLHDKARSPYTLSQPERYLSPRALARRARQGIRVDSTDLPVSPYYIAQLRKLGLTVRGTSRWHNTATVASATDNVRGKLRGVAFVDSCVRLYVSPDSLQTPVRPDIAPTIERDTLFHKVSGYGYGQLHLMNGEALHNAGFRGRGMMIAILDAGYQNVDRIKAFRNVNIVATKDFGPRPTNDIFAEHYHGTMVLSCMAMNHPDTIIGTAPEASYVLIRTEDIPTETRAEEDSWTMGAEYADSIGADLINSSLGYTRWDGDSTPVRYRDLDGRTSYISQTASMLAGKGIILCNSAGNEGALPWHKIGIPADASDILTVGAVNSKGRNAIFSSLGPTSDGRVKPDVCAMGANSYVVDGSGSITTANGTSFASPILCGMVACFWQAHPELTARQLMQLVREHADRFQWPDNVYGYGIPSFIGD